MHKLKIAVVGAGWLGLPLAQCLQADGHAVVASASSAEGTENLRAQGLNAFTLKAGADRVGELPAVDVLVITLPPRGSQQTASTALSQLAEMAAPSARHILYMSSTAVYPDLGRVVTEGDAEDIASPHSGLRLLALEEHLQTVAACPVTVLRLGGLFGPGRHPGRFLAGKKDVVGPDSPVNLVHRDDVIAVIQRLVELPFPKQNQVFNQVAPAHPTRTAFYDRACELAELPPIQWRPGSAPFKLVSSERLMHELDFSFRYPDPLAALDELVI